MYLFYAYSACMHMDACLLSCLCVCVCVCMYKASLYELKRPEPWGAEGQTSIIRRCGATGLAPLVRGRLGWFAEDLIRAAERDQPGGVE